MTLLEVVLILLVMGILTATVAVHVNSGTADLAVSADSISSQIRLVQTLAMNSSHALWGIQFNDGTPNYRIFQWEDASDNDMQSFISIPNTGTDAGGWITLSDNGIRFDVQGNKDNIAFDGFGKPYRISSSGATLLTNNPFTLTLVDTAGNTNEIQVTPKTGFVP